MKKVSNKNNISTSSKTKVIMTPAVEVPRKQKSLFITYVLWLFGGFFGLHHFYLHRDRHAFLWWSSLGGYFGIGWFCDLFAIPGMVRDANEDPRFIQEFNQQLQKHRKPPFSTYRFIGAILIAYLWGQIILLAIPDTTVFDINWNFLHWTIPFAVALGIWTVGNVGREKGTLWVCLATAYLVYPIRYYVYDEMYWYTAMVVLSAFSFDMFSKQWNRDVPKRHTLKRRIIVLTVAGCLYLSVFGAFMYFNGKITDSDGDEIPIHEAIRNIYTSPWWTDLKQQLHELWQYGQHHGWYEIWKQIIESLDMEGEKNAYNILGISATASQAEITTAWRSLSKENHPDKQKDESQRKNAQEKFMEIQQAYEILSKIKSKRRRKNKMYNDEL